MQKPLHVTIPITKVDEDQRMVYGYATVEELDAHGEIISYEASKEAFSNWIGNIREMHQDIAVGKAIDIEFDDDAKGVWIGAKISESTDGENAWTKVKEGVLAGFSIGGRINDATTKEVTVDGKKQSVRYITDYSLGETSLVDNPAVASAVFQMVKSKDGQLFHEEKMQKQTGRKVHWWEKMYKFSNSQEVMKPEFLIYNEDSMSKSQTITKDVFSAGMLLDLGRRLADEVWYMEYEGKNVDALKDALESIKQAAKGELDEEENWPKAVEESIELAMKTLDISKGDLMSKDATKSTTGQPDRDATGEEVTTAEDNGRPINDTEERAAENDVPVAGEVTEGKDGDKEVQPLVVNPEDKSGEADNPDANAVKPKEETVVEGKPGKEVETKPKDSDKDGDDGKGKKSAGAEDIQKGNEQSDLAKSILSGVADLIEKSVQPLKEEIDSLKKQAAPSKVKSSFAIQKGDDVENGPDNSEDAKMRKEFDDLVKRSEELERSPSVGSHTERLQIAHKMRVLSRKLDPASVAKHAAVKATFNTSQ